MPEVAKLSEIVPVIICLDGQSNCLYNGKHMSNNVCQGANKMTSSLSDQSFRFALKAQ